MVMDYDATPQQKQLITRYCMALKIIEPLEERPMTKGTAGKLIRELEQQVQWQRQKKQARQ